MKETKLKTMTRVSFFIIFSMIFFSILLYGSTSSNNYNMSQYRIENIILKEDTISLKDSLRNEMILEIKDYMKKQSPKADPMIAEYIVEHGLNADIDLCFIMSQTQLETNYGVAGVGKQSSRRSLFGVVKKKYPSYDDAIEDYTKILKRSYLVKGRTEHDLLQNYVTGNGYRYASSLTYEKDLSGIYRTIKKKTNVDELQKQYREC